MNYDIKKIRQLLNMSIEKAISLLEEALKGEEEAKALKNSILQQYGVATEKRAQLYKDFYLATTPVFGKYLEDNFEESEEMWPFEIDMKVSTHLEKVVSDESMEKFNQLQEQVFDSFIKIDTQNYNFCEVFLSDAFMDLLYYSALLVCKEHPELANI